MKRPIRLATRAIIMNEDKLLIVNAWRGRTHLWCAPGGGAEPHQSLPANLSREVFEETGITVKVGEPCLVNEFHDPEGDFHQVDIYFRCEIVSGDLHGEWTDPEGVVSHRRWVTRAELSKIRLKPDSLAAVAWRDPDAPTYDALEPILR
ncbi:NUDIX domain-containing protein [Marivivens donghaensis]|uniref:NUDIX domain-containing protein n=1 Tax=Marivivens donghaensis TaxID=1699413 RepID=A0ABX0W0Q4_9RHOB|nr:NUDIX domain-containing protein [Marivivens donghaensis]NIY73912.1 NUDIX domain-containing protein [Marivivens donghaensis]